MTVQRKRSGSVVSGSRGGSVVNGSRHSGGGRIIGEVLSGGRNTSGVAVKKRAAPRPTKDSARHSLRPAPKAVTIKQDDYSDFGLDDWDDDWADDWDGDEIEAGGASARSTGYGGVTGRLPQTGAAEVHDWYQFLVVLGVIFRRLFMLGVGYTILFMAGFFSELNFLRVAIIPLLLAFWCGAKIWPVVKREMQNGLRPGNALLCIAFGILASGVGLYAVARFVGFSSTFILAEALGLPYALYQYADIIDMGINRLFTTFHMAAYAVVPLVGFVVSWTFGRR